ncbi:spore germination protein [Bacillus sp. FJAT-45037]|uniref:spore germination protein n=1 Tax=Bacillus sp. FJAT-45037 TaxID=2011007 RepID=UPI000C2309B3|nr:spore germination protein [Bacillus sp. FJAT-45037]
MNIKKIRQLLFPKRDYQNKNSNHNVSEINRTEKPTLEHTLHEFDRCEDLIHRTFPTKDIHIVYFEHLVDNDELNREVIKPFSQIRADEVNALLHESQFNKVDDTKGFINGILKGSIGIFFSRDTYLIDVYGPPSRNIIESETESIITGPHDGFIESIGSNLSLIRRRIRSSHLKTIKLSVGEITKTDVYILYIEGIAEMEMVDDLIQRIKDIEYDGIYDSTMLIQLIDDSPYSLFPQFLTTERPDVATSKLLSGKIVGISDNSPTVFSAPTALFEFFQSPDDYYNRWVVGTVLRYLRYLAFVITIIFTGLYVSVTTFHYEMIPESLLITLSESRKQVPFPPLIEALVMETTLELLREAGARLPSKVGQTIGIVGGIVIGQAAVQAGLTSNILIIVVATSAIASFVIPSYIMSGSIRIIRFGLIILAGVFGNFGILVGITILIIHLSKLTSLRASYLTPIAPMYIEDWRDILLRAPYSMMKGRPAESKTSNVTRSKMRR